MLCGCVLELSWSMVDSLNCWHLIMCYGSFIVEFCYLATLESYGMPYEFMICFLQFDKFNWRIWSFLIIFENTKLWRIVHSIRWTIIQRRTKIFLQWIKKNSLVSEIIRCVDRCSKICLDGKDQNCWLARRLITLIIRLFDKNRWKTSSCPSGHKKKKNDLIMFAVKINHSDEDGVLCLAEFMLIFMDRASSLLSLLGFFWQMIISIGVENITLQWNDGKGKTWIELNWNMNRSTNRLKGSNARSLIFCWIRNRK